MKTKVAKAVMMLAVLASLYSFDVPKGWYKAGSAAEKYEIGIDRGAGMDGSNAATIRAEGARVRGFGTLVQNVKPGNFAGRRIRMSGYIKTSEVSGWGGFWLRIDQDNSAMPLAFDNMANRKIKGSTDWVKCEIIVNVPKKATNIAYGALLSGGGQLWFDNLTFEIVDETVATTIPYPKDNAPQTEPTNLSFEN